MKPSELIISKSFECKNCKKQLDAPDKFCRNCSAKVINERITVKNLFSDFAENILGWDNKFFFTVRMLILKPHVLLKEYIEGTRKKYMNPFTLLGLSAALALFVFNFFADHYLALNVESNKQSIEIMATMMKNQFGEGFDEVAYKKDTMELVTKMSSFMLSYFNILVLLFLPAYTLLAFLTYRKPYNYGEHLVINSYIQSFSFLVTSIIFIISVFTDPSVYIITIIFLIIYYTFAYGKLHKLTVAESILKLLIFFGILIAAIIIIMIVAILLGIASKVLTG